MPRRSSKQPSRNHPIVKPKWRWVWVFVLLSLWLICTGATPFYSLSNRLDQFPNWQTKPPLEAALGDLVYPDWFAGEWVVTTTLMDLQAPLAPDVVTPGFESNREYLNQPVEFRARFVSAAESSLLGSWLQRVGMNGSRPSPRPPHIVADRAFNGLNLAKAYLNQSSAELGDRLVLNVKVDPDNPNRQITLMRGDRQLVSTVTGRRVEAPSPEEFITSELFQQLFRGIPSPYLNEVETTTRYWHSADPTHPITADQVTAVYLSPQSPDYFKAGDRPVALYRYHLEFAPIPM